MSSVENFVNEFIAKDKIVIFSKSTCPYCKQAKEIFDKLGAKYTALEIETRPDCSEIQDTLKKITGQRTVPQIFISGKSIGGCSDLKKLHEANKLECLIKN